MMKVPGLIYFGEYMFRYKGMGTEPDKLIYEVVSDLPVNSMDMYKEIIYSDKIKLCLAVAIERSIDSIIGYIDMDEATKRFSVTIEVSTVNDATLTEMLDSYVPKSISEDFYPKYINKIKTTYRSSLYKLTNDSDNKMDAICYFSNIVLLNNKPFFSVDTDILDLLKDIEAKAIADYEVKIFNDSIFVDFHKIFSFAYDNNNVVISIFYIPYRIDGDVIDYVSTSEIHTDNPENVISTLTKLYGNNLQIFFKDFNAYDISNDVYNSNLYKIRYVPMIVDIEGMSKDIWGDTKFEVLSCKPKPVYINDEVEIYRINKINFNKVSKDSYKYYCVARNIEDNHHTPIDLYKQYKKYFKRTTGEIYLGLDKGSHKAFLVK